MDALWEEIHKLVQESGVKVSTEFPPPAPAARVALNKAYQDALTAAKAVVVLAMNQRRYAAAKAFVDIVTTILEQGDKVHCNSGIGLGPMRWK
jgi:hypothetical protein